MIFSSQSPNFFLSQSKKITKNFSIFQKSFAKRFPGHLDWWFGNLAINVSQKSETFPLKLQNLQKIKVFSKKNPQSLHLDSPNAVLTPLGENFFPKTKTILVKKRKRLKNQNFSQNKFSICFPGHVNWGFDNHALIVFAKIPESFRSKFELFSFKLRKFTEELSIFQESCFVKSFSWTRRMWFLIPCLEFFLPKSETFSLKVQKLLKKSSIF